jgi:quercetin dioxygenase-like cupin family protein
MKTALPVAAAAALLPLQVLAVHTASLPVAAAKGAAEPRMVQNADIRFQDVPDGFQVAVLRGDPGKAGALFTMRAKFPDGFKVPPHWHPAEEGFVVLQGTFALGLGDKWDEAKLEPNGQGAYVVMPKGVRHFALARGETILELTGIGPFKTVYVDAKDAPAKKK